MMTMFNRSIDGVSHLSTIMIMIMITIIIIIMIII